MRYQKRDHSEKKVPVSFMVTPSELEALRSFAQMAKCTVSAAVHQIVFKAVIVRKDGDDRD